jgi:hypothetical protein
LNIWRRYTRGINELYEIKLSKEKIRSCLQLLRLMNSVLSGHNQAQPRLQGNEAPTPGRLEESDTPLDLKKKENYIEYLEEIHTWYK